MVRPATMSDMAHLMRLGAEMFMESRFSKFPYAHEKVEQVFRHYICSPDCIVLVSDHGLLLASVQEQWFCRSTMAEDQLIYVSAAHRKGLEGVRLIKAYVAEAKKMGAGEVFVGSATGINEERVGKLYERLGFERIGGYYVLGGEKEGA